MIAGRKVSSKYDESKMTVSKKVCDKAFEKQCRLFINNFYCTMMTAYGLRLYIASIVLMLSSLYEFAVIVTLSANDIIIILYLYYAFKTQFCVCF